jgi:hypothetical protein
VTERSLYVSLFYLPINLKSRKTDEEWLGAIYNEWNDLDHTMSASQAESLYLETAQRWKFFGGNVFYIESKQFPKANAIVVHKEGLAVLRLPEKEPQAFAPFRGNLPLYPRSLLLSLLWRSSSLTMRGHKHNSDL